MERFQSYGPISSPDDVEAAASHLMESIAAALEEATTQLPRDSTRRRGELPVELRQKLRLKRALHKRWVHSRCPSTKRELNSVAEELSAEIAIFRGRTWDSLLDSISEEEGRLSSLYRLTRSLTQAPQPIHPLVDESGTRHYAAQARATLLADHLERQFQPFPIVDHQHNEDVERRVRETLDAELEPLPGDFFFSPAEVSRASMRLKPRKAPGPDGITNSAISQLPPRAIVAFTRLCNGILRTGHFPSVWKQGKVIVLPKPGKDRRQPASYRPITLLPHPAKLFERLFLRRLKPLIALRDEQFGFREGHSTTLQLTRVLHHLATELNKSRCSVGVFLDIEKAFDRVWHAGLLFKLLESSVPAKAVKILASFLEGRRFHVAVEGQTSAEKTIKAGVPQGSCLSPVLYALYTNDIPSYSDIRTEGEEDVILALFADDSAYITSSRKPQVAANRMQRLLDLLPTWLDRWRMSVNVGKTAALLTSRRRLPPPLRLRGQDVEWTNTVRYLGCEIDRTLRMGPMAKHVVRSAKAARAMLRPVISSKLPPRVKIRIYKTFVRSRLTYAAPAWHHLLSTTNKKRIQAQQNIALRIAVGAPWFVRNSVIARDAEVQPIEEFVTRLSKRMFDRADNGHHLHLRGIAPLHARPPDGRPLPRECLRDEVMEG